MGGDDKNGESVQGIVLDDNIFDVERIKREIANATTLTNMFAVQKETLDVLKNIRAQISDWTPDLFRQYAFDVTDASRTIDSSVIPTMPWIAFSVCNDGPDPVYVFVNEKVNIREQPMIEAQSSNVAPIRKGEQMRFNMKKTGIQIVYLQCASGKTSQVRIFSESKNKNGEV